jgi:hypothetical protein
VHHVDDGPWWKVPETCPECGARVDQFHRSAGSMALRNANRNRALQQASAIMPPGVIMTYGIRREPVPICARLDYVRTPGVLRDRQSFQRRGPSGGAFFGRADHFCFSVTGFACAFAFDFDCPVVAVRQ